VEDEQEPISMKIRILPPRPPKLTIRLKKHHQHWETDTNNDLEAISEETHILRRSSRRKEQDIVEPPLSPPIIRSARTHASDNEEWQQEAAEEVQTLDQTLMEQSDGSGEESKSKEEDYEENDTQPSKESEEEEDEDEESEFSVESEHEQLSDSFADEPEHFTTTRRSRRLRQKTHELSPVHVKEETFRYKLRNAKK